MPVVSLFRWETSISAG